VKRIRARSVVETDEPPPQPFTDPPPEETLAISDVVASEASSTVHVTWRTNFPALSQGADALGSTPVVWTAADASLMPATTTHETVFSGMSPGTSYNLWLRATDEWDRTATSELSVTTDGISGSTPARVDGSAIQVAGQPFFPVAIWNECTNLATARIDQGINLFMGEGCGRERELTRALGGKAYAVVDAQSGIASAPGVIGWYYPDELDGRLSPPLSAADVQSYAVTPPAGVLSFLTLTSHFYSQAAPLPIGRSLYPAFTSLANVVGFDIYPLQIWCRDDRFGDVYDAQRELEALAPGKPTFQWIEVRQMGCSSLLNPTPQTVAAETWLAIAGGAHGIGYFPREWSTTIGGEIQSLDRQIAELAPALLALDVQADAPAPLKVGARTLNGALYVIAVNTGRTPVDGTMTVDGAAARTFDVLDEGRQVVAADGALKDSFAPLAVHVYVAAPDGWSPPAPAATTDTGASTSPGYFPP